VASNDETGTTAEIAEGSASDRGGAATSTKAGTNDRGKSGGSPDPDQLVQEIEQTREDLAETLDAIVDKVSPKRVMDRTKEQARSDAQEALRGSMAVVKLARGQVLFSEGDPGDRLYVVTQGKIKLGRTAPDGRENLLAVLGPGEMFGELSIFVRVGPRRPASLAARPPRDGRAAARRAGSPAASDQRGNG